MDYGVRITSSHVLPCQTAAVSHRPMLKGCLQVLIYPATGGEERQKGAIDGLSYSACWLPCLSLA